MGSPITYRLSEDESQLYVRVYKDPSTILSPLSHDHVVRARGWTAELVYDPEDASASKIRVTIPVRKLEVDDPALRRKLEIKTRISEGDRRKTEQNMLKKNQLWADKYPTIEFVSTTFEPPAAASGKARVKGDLTVRGRTKRIDIPADVELTDGGLRAHTEFLCTHADFGFKPYKAALGTLKNAEELRFVVSFVAVAE